MREWSEDVFQARVRARLDQLGLTESAALRAVGGTGDEIRKVAKRGRRIDTLVLIARAMRWTLGQAIGLHDPTAFLDRDLQIEPRKLARAWQIARDAIGANEAGRDLVVLAEAASVVYSVLAEREAAGKEIDDEDAREIIAGLLRRSFPR